MHSVQLICRNRYRVGNYVVLKYGRYWRATKDDEKRRSCITSADQVVCQSENLDEVVNWCKTR